MTAIGLCLITFGFLVDAWMELVGSQNHWVEIALAYVVGIGFVLMACGFVLWVWRTFP